MTKPGWRNVLLRSQVVDRIEQMKAEKETDRPRRIALGAFIEDLIWPAIEGNEILRQYGPFLEKFGIDPTAVYIKDNKKDRIAECILQNGELYCRLCESLNCVHIGFAWSIPEVYKAMDLHGKKMPKVIE